MKMRELAIYGLIMLLLTFISCSEDEIDIPVTATGLTLIAVLAVKLPSTDVTVMVAVPTLTVVTRPVASTVATA